MDVRQPELSIVIPALNEATTLPYLLQDLSWQKNIQFEVIIVDGGSTDQTVNLCRSFAESASFHLAIIESQPGRALQLNLGAEKSRAEEILFLHADSRLRNASLLVNAKCFLHRQRTRQQKPELCGHFPLLFSSTPGELRSYYFYESKTHLNKTDCVNGDQGFWISRHYFNELGKFDESLPYMEDARLANKIARENNWITLPGKIETSARRFETEGFARRQLLNSFMCNFNAINEPDFFGLATNVYRQQNEVAPLQLRPFLKLTHQFMFSDGLKTATHRWYRTGSYIASNAWQLAFAIDCRKSKKLGLDPGSQEPAALAFYDKYLAPASHWPVVRAMTSVITLFWFYSLFLLK